MSNTESQRATTFWSSVTWPRAEGVLWIVLPAIGCFVIGALRREPVYGGVNYGAAIAVVILPVMAVVWAFYRVTKAWAEWPSESRWVAAIKSVVRFFIVKSWAGERTG